MTARSDHDDLAEVELYLAIEGLLLAQPARIWRGHEIATAMTEEIGTPLVNTMVALAILTGEGRIERTSPGHYRAPTATPEELIAALDL